MYDIDSFSWSRLLLISSKWAQTLSMCRWAGSFGVAADFMALSNCALYAIKASDVLVSRILRNANFCISLAKNGDGNRYVWTSPPNIAFALKRDKHQARQIFHFRRKRRIARVF